LDKRKESKTRWQKILVLFIEHKKHPERLFNLAQGPDGKDYGWEPVGEGWLPAYAFRGPYCGGDQADRRIRELKTEFGIPLEKKIHHWTINGQKKFTWVYRLACDPDEIDIENICMRPKRVEQGVLL